MQTFYASLVSVTSPMMDQKGPKHTGDFCNMKWYYSRTTSKYIMLDSLTYIYIYIYIYMCVCVCVCVCVCIMHGKYGQYSEKTRQGR